MRAAFLSGGVASPPCFMRRAPHPRKYVVWDRACARRVCRTAAASTSMTSTDGELELNAYDVLGVDVTASHRTVRDAFRRKAKDAHPDRGGTSEGFDASKRAQDVLIDDNARAKLDAKLMDVSIGSLSLEELKWSRELVRLAEEEEAGEVRGAKAVLASAWAYAVAERALAQIAVKKKKDAAKLAEDKKTQLLSLAATKRRKNAQMASQNDAKGEDATATLLLTPEMLDTVFQDGGKESALGRDGTDTSRSAGGVSVDATVETNCPKCHGWGEKEGHWTMAIDKLCVKCDGFGRVAVTKKVKVSLRKGIADGETVTVFGAGHAGYRRIANALGAMGDAGDAGDLLVKVRVLKEGRVL